MNPPVYRTVCPLPTFDFKVNYKDPLIFLGSCFSEHIGIAFNRYYWTANMNSHGIIFHPMAMAEALMEVTHQKEYTPDDLFLHLGDWCSWSHHGRFRHPNRDEALLRINSSISYHHHLLSISKVMFITFGTAWGYANDEERIVANCHRMPASTFEKRLTSHSEITACWLNVVDTLNFLYPDIKFIFTVSPVRHLRDGMHENQLSKSHLILSIQSLMESRPHCCFYFPAYEIFMDDLRDYRFYAGDMIHPSEDAVKHVWQMVRSTLIDEVSNRTMDDIEGLVLQLEHRYRMSGEDSLFAEIEDQILARIRQVKTAKS